MGLIVNHWWTNFTATWRDGSTSSFLMGARFSWSILVFMGKLLYCLQSTQPPMVVIKEARSIIYRFIWGTQWGMSWRRMVLTKEERGLGLRDPRFLVKCLIWRVWRIWKFGSSIWSHWMHRRYVKERGLSKIVSKSWDSPLWSSILGERKVIEKFIDCYLIIIC